MNWVVLGLLVFSEVWSSKAFSGSLAIREALNLAGRSFWRVTYEGFALSDRVLGHPIYNESDLQQLAERLEAPAHRAVAQELEVRLGFIRHELSAGTLELADAAHAAFVLAPERVSGRTEFLPIHVSKNSSFDATRQEFLAGSERRDVQIFLRGEYRPFQSTVLKRLEALGFRVKPIYRDSAVVLLGQAPEHILASLSGIDGVDSITASGRPYSPLSGRSGLAPQYFRHGVKTLSE